MTLDLSGLANLPEIENINKIIRVWQIPCTPSLEIWLETLIPATELVIVELFTPSTVEWIEMPLGRYHGPGGKVIRRLVKRIIPGVFEAAEGHWMWRFLAPIESILFWWMAVDLAEEGLYNWETLAFERAGCFDYRSCTSAIQGDTLYGESDDWQTVIAEYQSGDISLYAIDGMQFPINYAGTAGGHVTAVAVLPGSISSRVIDSTTDQVLYTRPPVPVGGDGPASVSQLDFTEVFKHRVPFSRLFKLQVKISGGPMNLKGSGMTASARLTI